MTLDEVLANWREEAAMLRRCGHERDAALREHMADEVAAATEDLRASARP